MKKIISVVGARPNFIKIAPVHRAFEKYSDNIKHIICHTGQHFDDKMSKVFFDELQMPKPDYFLGLGGGSHAVQTARIMVEFEKILLDEKPDLVIVPGDVNSTLAASLVAAKLHIPVAHVESGLRSFDSKMPEEINRVIADEISDYLFVTEKSGLLNLDNEGVDKSKVYFTGNVMIDSLIHFMPFIDKSTVLNDLGLEKEKYILSTFHRPSNVDNEEELQDLVKAINELADLSKIVFPIHPRTKNNLEKFGLISSIKENVIILEPLGYIDFLNLTKNAKLVITDSGGIQEETTFLGVQCITVRDNTERPITSEIGTNHMIGTDLRKVVNAAKEIIGGKIKKGQIPELWDGKTADRIAEIIYKSIC
ncbi:MAG: UDP-N-acetylglucosamine 2-epimerase (non-hydrolyzing) [Marinilabiliales bacterium]|nr:MAG: UDP-N-acetylglucosamine 2-epimerase (non-hydrolyzing) [Marinilabiliales bacterium]